MEELNHNNRNSIRIYVAVVSITAVMCLLSFITYASTNIAFRLTAILNIINFLLYIVYTRLRFMGALLPSLWITRLVIIIHLIGVSTCLNDYIYTSDSTHTYPQRGDSKNQGLIRKMALDAYTKLPILKLFLVEVFGRCKKHEISFSNI